MYQEHLMLIFSLLKSRIVEVSKQYGAGSEYTNGQLDEAYHQLELLFMKLQGSYRNGF